MLIGFKNAYLWRTFFFLDKSRDNKRRQLPAGCGDMLSRVYEVALTDTNSPLYKMPCLGQGSGIPNEDN